MTGTPLDLTPFGALLKGIGLIYWMLAALGLWWALRGSSPWRTKLLRAIPVVLLFGFFPGRLAWERHQSRSRLDASMALFHDRCKTAGERITRTVENVDGILLTNVRPKAEPLDLSAPNWPDAALPHESREDWYIRNFLFWEHHEDKRSARGYLNEQPSDLPGYRFVDVKSEDGKVNRYRLKKSERAELSRELVNGPHARYAVSFVNMIDPADRDKWVAGTKVLITDTATTEVIAEHTWFSIEPGQGNTAGFRTPWAFALTCPKQEGWGGGTTRFFVDQVLKPKREE